MSKAITRLLKPSDFEKCAVWGYDEKLEGYFEVRDQEDLELVESTADLQKIGRAHV